MAVEITVQVPWSLTNYIEKLDYEYNSMKELLVDAASRGIGSTAAYERWENKYKEAYAAYGIAKAQIEKEYVLPNTKGKKCTWSLEYSSGDLKITEEPDETQSR